jgi:hypothetical protein
VRSSQCEPVGDRPEVARLLGLEAPVPVGLPQQPVLVVGAGDESGFADGARGDHRPGLMIGGVEATVETDRIHQTRLGGTLHQVGGVGGVEGQRLLAHDVLAGVEGDTDLVGVGVVGLATWMTSMPGSAARASALS